MVFLLEECLEKVDSLFERVITTVEKHMLFYAMVCPFK
jgi:hypothetical protein